MLLLLLLYYLLLLRKHRQPPALSREGILRKGADFRNSLGAHHFVEINRCLTTVNGKLERYYKWERRCNFSHAQWPKKERDTLSWMKIHPWGKSCGKKIKWSKVCIVFHYKSIVILERFGIFGEDARAQSGFFFFFPTAALKTQIK